MANDSPPSTDASESPFTHVPIEVTVTVGKARPLVKDLLNLGEQAILPLDKRIEDPVDLYIGDRLIARGELQELEGDQAGQLSVRLTEVVDLKSGATKA
ncbi:FliM/FliN family flagellar motor switch protein [Roseobacter sp.]|uniref:FliM/FliN family flagellar motor switch protein n=1 Tax=Roseobacter sp. TaxID=1907202 RepID=UPI00385D3621